MKRVIVKDKWPEAISDGLTLSCSICGCKVMYDYHVDDDFWTKVVPEHCRRSVLCLACLDKLATDMDLDITKHLQEIQFTGIGKTIVLKPEKVFYYGLKREGEINDNR